ALGSLLVRRSLMLPNSNLFVPRIWDFCKRSNRYKNTGIVLGLTQNISQTLIFTVRAASPLGRSSGANGGSRRSDFSPCTLRLCGSLFRNSCVSPKFDETETSVPTSLQHKVFQSDNLGF
ncbi:MAG: hypothetical protein V7L05_15235, partial [Nostoc sp.]|uniref:hypothetical protein n=1 Tax=Nostoc sp. TaxID=1180 RepID=UPI002FF722A3